MHYKSIKMCLENIYWRNPRLCDFDIFLSHVNNIPNIMHRHTQQWNTHPLHLEQITFRVKESFFDVPRYKSSNDTFNGWTTSSPRLCLLPRLPPPNHQTDMIKPLPTNTKFKHDDYKQHHNRQIWTEIRLILPPKGFPPKKDSKISKGLWPAPPPPIPSFSASSPYWS